MQSFPASARQLGVWAATATVTGEAISLGIFLIPAGMARSLGSPALIAAVWMGMATVTLAGALCFSELAVRNPQDGGEYVYLRRGFGPRVAFLYGWMAAVVMYPGVAAALSVGATPYLTALLPSLRGYSAVFPPVLLILVGAVNYFGARLSASLMSAINWLKIAVLLTVVGWVFFSGRAHASYLLPISARHTNSDPLIGAVAGGAVSAFFCFGGWWEAGKFAGEVRNPARTLPIAFTGGVLIVTALYMLVNLAFVAVVPMDRIASNTAFVAQFGQALFGDAGASLLSACVLLCVLGGLLLLSMAVPRVTYALASAEGGTLATFARLHPRFGTPANAVLLQTGMALLVLSLGAFDHILSFIIFSAVVFLGLTVGTLFRKPHMQHWWFPTAPIVFLAGSLLLAFLLLMHDPASALLGAAIVLAGLPLRSVLFRRDRARAGASGGPAPDALPISTAEN